MDKEEGTISNLNVVSAIQIGKMEGQLLASERAYHDFQQLLSSIHAEISAIHNILVSSEGVGGKLSSVADRLNAVETSIKDLEDKIDNELQSNIYNERGRLFTAHGGRIHDVMDDLKEIDSKIANIKNISLANIEKDAAFIRREFKKFAITALAIITLLQTAGVLIDWGILNIPGIK